MSQARGVPTAGRSLWDAITTALGKRKMTVVRSGYSRSCTTYGTLASWWPSFVASGTGDRGGMYPLLQADEEKWEDFDEVLTGKSGLRL